MLKLAFIENDFPLLPLDTNFNNKSILCFILLMKIDRNIFGSFTLILSPDIIFHCLP